MAEPTGNDARAGEPEPRPETTRRRTAMAVLWVAFAAGFVFFVLPQLAGLQETLRRLSRGEPWMMR